jgi:hypothetical protein
MKAKRSLLRLLTELDQSERPLCMTKRDIGGLVARATLGLNSMVPAQWRVHLHMGAMDNATQCLRRAV